jgi:hypothetical protein
MFGVLGPFSFRTKSGGRVVFIGFIATVPLTALSLWALSRAPKHTPTHIPELDLSDRD